MESKNCVFCYRDLPDFERSKCSRKNNVSGSNEEAEEFAVLKNHMSVILLLRKFLDIPQEMCMNLLQDHGDPSSWIHSCEFCKTLVEKTENTYKQLVLVNKKFEMLKTELKTAIGLSSSSEYILPNRSGSKFGIETGPTEKVRSYILDQHIKREENIEIKFERPEFDDIELNSKFSDDQYQHNPEDVNINDRNFPVSANYIIPDKVLPTENNVHAPCDRSPSKAKRKTHKSRIKSIKSKKSGKSESVIGGVQPKLRLLTVLKGEIELEGPSSNILDYCSGCGKYEPNRKIRFQCLDKDRGPYKCSICPKEFSRTDSLKRHVHDKHTP